MHLKKRKPSWFPFSFSDITVLMLYFAGIDQTCVLNNIQNFYEGRIDK